MQGGGKELEVTHHAEESLNLLEFENAELDVCQLLSFTADMTK
jgi:hypothetical protein